MKVKILLLLLILIVLSNQQNNSQSSEDKDLQYFKEYKAALDFLKSSFSKNNKVDSEKINYSNSEVEEFHPQSVNNLKEQKTSLVEQKKIQEENHPHEKERQSFLSELIKEAEKNINSELVSTIQSMTSNALEKIKDKNKTVLKEVKQFFEKEEKSIEDKINFLFQKAGGN